MSLSVLFQNGARSKRDDLFDGVLRALQTKYPDRTLGQLLNAGDRMWNFIGGSLFG